MNGTYQPQPIDTSHVQIPPPLDDLLETLAAHTHDVWASQRISDGWSYGPRRDDDRKQTPCLVPYPDLPDKEQEYDRKTSAEVIRAILKLGLQIVPPPNNEPPEVVWEPRALDRIHKKDLRDGWNADLCEIFRDSALQLIVSDVFRGYSIREQERIVLGVQVVSAVGPRSYVVKLGKPDEVANDYQRWQECMRDSSAMSTVLVNVRGHGLSSGRSAAVYEDAYRLFGTDPAAESPHSLEAVVTRAVHGPERTVDSIEQVLEQIFSQLNRTLYVRAVERDAAHVKQFYAEQLTRRGEQSAWQRWQSMGDLLDLRSHALWLASLNGYPSDPELPRYLDPWDYLRWALMEAHCVPTTLVGYSHGDLHARNILVGFYRQRAQQPVIFDYGEMKPDNLLVWDFVKLEMELKCAILPALLGDRDVRQALLAKVPELGRPPVGEEHQALSLSEEELARRVDRLEAALIFESLLAHYAQNIDSREAAERPLAASDIRYQTGCLPLDHALRIFYRIRQEAACYLVYEKERPRSWQADYYFALAVYGLLKAKWTPEGKLLEVPLIAAGVAARQHQTSVAEQSEAARIWGLRGECPPAEYPEETLPSHLFALGWAHQLWSDKQHQRAIKLLDHAGRQFPQAITLEPERALCLASAGETFAAERSLRRVGPLCRVFRDHETLCRIGRVLKDSGDREFEAARVKDPREFAKSAHPAWQLYCDAYNVYRQAYEISGSPNRYYPAINAATLAMLLGLEDEAADLAIRADELCTRATEPREGTYLLDSEQQVWIAATRGEAQLLLRDSRAAASQYRRALTIPHGQRTQIAESMFHQICRLHWALGPAVVQPVVELFARTVDLSKLKPGPFGNGGNCG